MNLNESTIFITGANRGIGRALLEELIKNKNIKRIYAAARKTETLKDFAGDLVVPIKLDITDRIQVKTVVEQTRDTTILINNAGVLAFGSLLDSPLEMIVRDLETNYYGTLNMIRAFAPLIENNGGGAIVNVLTLVALASMSGIGGYSASKAAAFSLTQAVRAELKSKNISVHGIFPGAIDTQMIAGMEMPKTNPQIVAAAIIKGIADGAEDIFPDPMAEQMSRIWMENPKELERTFASM